MNRGRTKDEERWSFDWTIERRPEEEQEERFDEEQRQRTDLKRNDEQRKNEERWSSDWAIGPSDLHKEEPWV